ncbi:MAG TPA: response regulator [Terriglobales bacterium]|nr:response regulator [Terriglobales bacterium]
MRRAKLLCVDDDPGIREFYDTLFGSHDYEVIPAADGRQALSILRSHPKQIDAVISDYDMPGMSGPELAAQVKLLRPDLPVIIVSGSQPVLEEAPHFVDAAMAKGAPIQEILRRVGVLVGSREQELRRARFVPLGSALATVAVGALIVGKRFS